MNLKDQYIVHNKKNPSYITCIYTIRSCVKYPSTYPHWVRVIEKLLDLILHDSLVLLPVAIQKYNIRTSPSPSYGWHILHHFLHKHFSRLLKKNK